MDLSTPQVAVGDLVSFDGKRTRWLARAASEDGRWTLLTAQMFGKVFYSIIDWRRAMRGPMNVIGWGLGIFTVAGPDEAIDHAMEMLRPYPPLAEGETLVLGDLNDGPRGFELSHRGEVRLDITSVDTGLVPVLRPNGKWYLPEKPPAQVEFSDVHDETCYVAVLRTHDLGRARAIARPTRLRHLCPPDQDPQFIWLRQMMRDGQPWWESDPGRGVPAVLFEECEEPCPTEGRQSERGNTA